MMLDAIDARFKELIATGRALAQRLPYNDFGPGYWVGVESQVEYQRWLSTATNLIRLVAPRSKSYNDDLHQLTTHENLKNGLPALVVRRMLGLVEAAQSDWESGLLRQVEFMIAAETFDDFLDKAVVYHKGNRKIESAVLASAVLEDTVKKICMKNDVVRSGRSLEELIDDLVKADTLTPVKAKRVKAAAGVRNHALHAEWEEFDIKDVGGLLETLRELVSEYL
jgi:hypothetical protein